MICELLNYLRRAKHREISSEVHDSLADGGEVDGIADSRIQEKEVAVACVDIDVYGARCSSDKHVADEEIVLAEKSRSIVLSIL